MSKQKQIIPRAPYVLVKPIDKKPQEESKSGFIIPDSVEKEQKSQGTVIRMPKGVMSMDSISEGVVIVYGAYAGEDILVKEGDEKVHYKLIHDEDIIAVIE